MFTFTLRLDTAKNQKRKKGYPVVVFLNAKNKRKKITLGLYFQKSEWDFKKQLPKKNPNAAFEIKKKIFLLEELQYKSRISGSLSLEKIEGALKGYSLENVSSFYEFYESLIQEQKNKGKLSNAKVYENAMRQLKKFRPQLQFSDLDYMLFSYFKDYQFKMGNSKNTISSYLRTYRAIYNEAVRRGLIKDTKPFKDVFVNVTVKANRTKKRYLTKASIKLLEGLQGLPMAQQRSVDLFLLLFYFGGQDLKDVYYLERKQMVNGRMFFTRGKLDGAGYEFDLKIIQKAQKIIDKYQVKGKYIFGWRKDFNGYRTFRDNFRRNLLKVVKDYNAAADSKIEVQPKGGNVTIKVARHTFATIGKQLFIETDLLRELMGHERNDVDTIYKDKYPQKVRDEAHKKIVS